MKLSRFSWRTAQHARERLAVMALAFLLGSAPVLLWWVPDGAALHALEDEVAQLQSRLQPALPSRARQAQVAQAVTDWPYPDESSAAWTWLQQGAQAHGLQVQALQAQPVLAAGDSLEQPVRWRLQGPWHQWLTLETALHEHAPWWVVDQWQVLPDAEKPGDVRIELQARLGLQPQSGPATLSRPRDWPAWRHARAPEPPGAEVFALAQGAGLSATAGTAASAASQATESLPADPRLWPVRELRLLGVWWQAGTAHAVLGRGLSQVTVLPGQRIGREAYRVQRVSEAGVELVAVHGLERGTVLQLTGTGER